MSGRAILAALVAELALGHRRNKTGAQQTMLQECGSPGGIVDIGLRPGDGFDMLRMNQQDLKRTFEHVEHGFPIVTGTLHRDMRAAVLPNS